MKVSSKVHAHDELNKAQEGDTVTVKECRPISKSKTWILVDELDNGNISEETA